MGVWKPVNAVGYAAMAVYVLFWLVAFGSGSYGAYHAAAASFIRLRSAGLRDFIWPDTQGAGETVLPATYLVHRNKSRRGGTLFFLSMLFAMAVLLISIVFGSERVSP